MHVNTHTHTNTHTLSHVHTQKYTAAAKMSSATISLQEASDWACGPGFLDVFQELVLPAVVASDARNLVSLASVCQSWRKATSLAPFASIKVS